jgi:dUTP pyrophosphatase
LNFDECGDYVSPKFNPEWITGTLMSTALEEIEVVRMGEGITLPSRKHPSDAGLDFFNSIDAVIQPGEVSILTTGVCIKIPDGFVGLIWPKSRSDYLIGGGVIDSGYRGEIMVKVINTSGRILNIKKGDAICQLLIQPIETPRVKEVTKEEFLAEETERGNSGGIVSQYKTSTLESKIESIE